MSILNNKFTKQIKRKTSTQSVADNNAPTLSNEIFSYFNITNKEYVLNTMYDGFGLYSIIDWTNSTRKTFIEKNNNLNKTKKKILIINNSNNYGNTKTYRKKKNNKNSNGRIIYSKNSIVTSSIYGSEYKYIDSLNTCGIRAAPDYKKCKEPSFRCVILQNVITNDYLVLLRYGIPISFYDDGINKQKKKITACYEFIKANTNNDNNIMLFGMSMGGNMAQHIALEFGNNPRIYVISLCIGNTLKEEDYERFINNYNGRFISLALGYYEDNKLYIDEYLRLIMYRDTLRTIPTIILALEFFDSIWKYGQINDVIYYINDSIDDSSRFNSIETDRIIHNFTLLYNVLFKTLPKPLPN